MYDDEFSASSELFDVDLKTRILGVVPTVFLNNQEVTKNQYE
jgi:hypothetical protein